MHLGPLVLFCLLWACCHAAPVGRSIQRHQHQHHHQPSMVCQALDQCILQCVRNSMHDATRQLSAETETDELGRWERSDNDQRAHVGLRNSLHNFGCSRQCMFSDCSDTDAMEQPYQRLLRSVAMRENPAERFVRRLHEVGKVHAMR
eukprot:gnl/Spiro4/18021_TR9622_c0_g1_i1.p5 gnl/Spiro4/18021_TR9622_c0_g1~~gnl/Spiro4/18021_TR9622_c0_g1_i1.p5  ORF type:complete len:157 (-),score=55.34 gnl/Spiro4/18021_TR9622_c0_g1_i1:50-490(-)